jgi:uncharacterized protein (TIGR02391 family)
MQPIKRHHLPVFTPGQLEAICRALADYDGLTHAEIGQILAQCRIPDVDRELPKWKRLFNALAVRLNQEQHSNGLLNFVRHALDPARYTGQREVFEDRRARVNTTLAFVGLQFGEDGRFHRTSKAESLPEAEQRADRLRSQLAGRGVHPDVLRFCRAELVQDNYFHAVLEATKSVAAKIRTRTGLTTDGAELVDSALGGSSPILRINPLRNDSHWSEQRGFGNLLKGTFGMFRNPTAHAARIEWPMAGEDALDLLVLVSYAHRRLDRATVSRTPSSV